MINSEQLVKIARPDGDCIPEHFRKELGLPAASEMEGFSIDFNEVRIMDA